MLTARSQAENYARALVASGSDRSFGLITTNSLRQTLNRRVVQVALDKGVALTFAIPDHPWVDSANGAAVRIAMTVGAKFASANWGSDPSPKGAGSDPNFAARSETNGRLLTVASETTGEFGEVTVTLLENTGLIHADLSVGADVTVAKALQANLGLSYSGVEPHGKRFVITVKEATSLRLGTVAGLEKHIRDYCNGRDLTDVPRNVKVIDLFGLTAEQVRTQFPAL